MSIIEKALEKLDDAEPEPRAKPKPASIPEPVVTAEVPELVEATAALLSEPVVAEPTPPRQVPTLTPAPGRRSESLLEPDDVVLPGTMPQSTSPAPLPPPPAAREAAPASRDGSTPATDADSQDDRVSRKISLDLPRLELAGFLTPNQAQSLIAEEYRLLKRPVLRRSTQGDPDYLEHGNLVIVTSSLPGEGKTYMSINLAMSIAMEVDRTVLLVDADVAKADVSRVLGVHDEQGLSSYLSGKERDLSKLILRTNVEKLSLLPSGPHYSKLTELLSSRQMAELVSELAHRYPDRIVLFDSPPLLATSGAPVLTSLMGQVLMVVEAVRTPKSAVKAALKQMAGVRNLNFVLNKQRHRSAMGYGSYGYGYGRPYAYGNRPMEH